MSVIKVLIVDDVALVRERIEHVFDRYPEIQVIDKVGDPYAAAASLKKNVPDVIILDIEMPNMDGLTFLKKIMKQFPIPVIILSGAIDTRPRMLYQAMKFGAFDVLSKDILLSAHADKELLESVILAFDTDFNSKKTRDNLKYNIQSQQLEKTKLADSPLSSKLIAIGSSTGGITAVSSILSQLHNNLPGIVVAQHLPQNFVVYFMENLSTNTPFHVKIAEDGEFVKDGVVYICPGDKHITVKKSDRGIRIVTTDEAKVNHHRPSVDVLFESVAGQFNKDAVGVILTGMGKDGAKGLRKMRDNGLYTIGQDEESSVVYGMPHQAIVEGAVVKQASLKQIPSLILESI